MLTFKAFGTPRIEGEKGEFPIAIQRQTIALLGILAVAGRTGIRRGKLLELLWPDLELDRGRRALAQALYHAKRSLSELLGDRDLITPGTGNLQLDRSILTTDVAMFEEAVARGDLEAAADLYAGPFLDGLILPNAPEFERWLTLQRTHFSRAAAKALDATAAKAEAAQDWTRAVEWLQRLSIIEPLSSSVAIRLMGALAASGNKVRALSHAHEHTTRVATELDTAPDPEVLALEEKIRSEMPAHRHTPDRAIPAHTPEQQSAKRTAPKRDKKIFLLAAATVATLLLVIVIVWHRSVHHSEPIRRNEIFVVAPFRVVGPSGKEGEANQYLSEGIMDLLVTDMKDIRTINMANPGAVPRAWRAAGWTPVGGVPFNNAIDLAKQFRVTHLIGGKVVILPQKLIVTGWIADVNKGRIETRTTIEGSPDSITAIVNNLVDGLKRARR